MSFENNHLYKDERTNKILIFDYKIPDTGVYFFIDLDTLTSFCYFEKELKYLKEY